MPQHLGTRLFVLPIWSKDFTFSAQGDSESAEKKDIYTTAAKGVCVCFTAFYLFKDVYIENNIALSQ